MTALLLSALTANAQQLTPAQIKALPECSLAKTNSNCKLIIDRSSPVAPPTVQMYSRQALTIILKHPKAYERYFLDYQSGQATLSPDVASGIVQGLLGPLAKLQVTHEVGIAAVQPQVNCEALLTPMKTDGTASTVICDVQELVADYKDKLGTFAKGAGVIYKDLEPCVSPDSLLPPLSNPVSNDPCKIEDLLAIQNKIDGLLPSEFELSGKIAVISANLKAVKVRKDGGEALLHPEEAQELTAYLGIADAVAKDLLGYSQRITDLKDFKNGAQDCANLVEVVDPNDHVPCVYITSNQDNDSVYRNMVTRTITYALNTLNLVSNSQEAVPDPTKKKLLASIVINFADSPKKPSTLRWEASAGAFFSSLPVRSFSVAPVFTSGAISDNKIAQNILHPTVVPFAAASYRISNDLGWTRWKSSIYWTGAVGVNPNTVSADFASGFSVSWRSLMFSPLWHYGHDVRLTQGLYVGESLGASFKGSLATQTYWKSSFALGVSIRVPSLTGR